MNARYMFYAVFAVTLAAAHAERPDPAKFQAAKAACEASQYNTSGIQLPDFQPPVRGERPQFSEAQRELLRACEQAGILPQHHGRHREPGGNAGAPPVRDESQNDASASR